MKTLVKIVFNKKFNEYRALIAVADKNGNKIQNFGFDRAFPYFHENIDDLKGLIRKNINELYNPVCIGFQL